MRSQVIPLLQDEKKAMKGKSISFQIEGEIHAKPFRWVKEWNEKSGFL